MSSSAARMIDALSATGLKEVMRRLGMPASGTKAEMTIRIRDAIAQDGTLEDRITAIWTEDLVMREPGMAAGTETPANTSVAAMAAETSTQQPRGLSAEEEIRLLRREKELIERELALYRRESELERRSPQVLQNPYRPSDRALKDMAGDFQGSGDSFERWESQIKMIVERYKLEETASHALIVSSLKGEALEWFHSKPLLVQATVSELLDEMKQMYDQRPSKQILRKQFEARTWKPSETFSDYYHQKIVMANKILIDDEELIDSVIDGIQNITLQNQVRMHNFKTLGELRDAMCKIKMPVAPRGRDPGPPPSTPMREKTRIARESKPEPVPVRCFNCSEYGHTSRQCTRPRREKNGCFSCGSTDHVIKECPNRAGSTKKVASINHVAEVAEPDEFHRSVKYEISDKKEVRIVTILDTLLDSGSPVSFIKRQFVPEQAIVRDMAKNKFVGINQAKLVIIGSVSVSFALGGEVQDNVILLVVPDETMTSSVVLGRDCIQRAGYRLIRVAEPDHDKEIAEIMSIDTLQEKDSVKDSLSVGPEVTHTDRERLTELFEIDYVKPERPDTPKISTELQLIVKDVQPFHFSPRRLSYKEKEELSKIIDGLLQRKIIQPSNSEYVSPIVLVKKKNGEYRMCIDYRALNKCVARDNYPIPVIEEQLNVLRNKKYFTILDLKDGFYHVSMAEESRQYTSFTTHLGQFEFIKMPFGLKPAPTKFQRYVTQVLGELIRSGDVVVYMDDCLIATETLEHHFIVLKRLFKILVDNCLYLRIDKCKFIFQRLEYLGYSVSVDGISPTDSGVNAVSRFPIPRNVRSVQSFLGLCSYFRKFIEGFSIIAKPLYDLVKKDVQFKFTEVELSAFRQLKAKLVEAPVLAIYDPHDLTELHCDASALGFGAVLMQRKKDLKLHPVLYFSKRTTDIESRYHSFELETLAIVYALKRFRIYLHGIPFKIITDCNSLKLTLAKKDINPRIARWALELQCYDYEVQHRPGDRMRHVDALSRSFEICIIEDNPFEFNLSVCQMRDGKIKELRDRLEKMEDRYFEMRNGIVYRKKDSELLFYVPDVMEKNVMFKYHDQMGHLGAEKTAATMMQTYWFPNLRQKVKEHIANCLKCLSFSPSSGKVEGNVHSIPKGQVPFTVIHVDHYGPVDNKCAIKKYVFLVVDGFTKHVRLYATKTTSSKEVILCLTDYFQSYSKPHVIVSDRGTCFTSVEFQEYLVSAEIKHSLVATGSPQANGQVERVNRVLGPMLSKLSDNSAKQYWYKVLPEVEYSLNNTIHKCTGETPCKLLFGVNQRGRVNDAIREHLDENVNSTRKDLSQVRAKALDNIVASQKYNEDYFKNRRKDAVIYKEGDYVLLRNFDSTPGASRKLIPQFKGPYQVTKVLRNDRYVVADIEGFQNTQKRYQGVWEAKNMRAWISDKS